jgi:hypothetical protein
MSSIVLAQAPKWITDNNGQNPGTGITLDSVPPQGSIILWSVVINQYNGYVAVTPPAGFTAIADRTSANMRVLSYYKIAGPSEPRSFVGSTPSSRPIGCIIVNWSGEDSGAPLDVQTSATGNSVNPTTGTVSTSAVIAERHFAHIGYMQNVGSDLTNPTNGYSFIINTRVSGAGGNENLGFQWGVLERDMPGPSTGPAGCTVTAPIDHDWAGLVFAIRSYHIPVTYVKTGQITANNVKVSGGKLRSYVKTGSVIGPASARGPRTVTRARAGTLISAGVLNGFRPALYGRTGSLKLTSILSGDEVHFRGATITRITTDFLEGIAAAQVATTGAGPYQGAYTEFTPTQTDPHTASIYLRATVPLRLRIATAAGATIDTSATIEPTGNWMRAWLTPGQPMVAGTKYRFFIETTEAVATAFYMDAAQVEVGVVASPFVTGSRPSGLGPVGDIIHEQKPAALVGQYVVVPGTPGIWSTYQVLYDNHIDYEDVIDTKQTYKQAYENPGP